MFILYLWRSPCRQEGVPQEVPSAVNERSRYYNN